MRNSLKEKLQNEIPENLIGFLNRSFEVVGNIAIIEVEKELLQYEKLIAKTILKTNSSIKTILKKDGIHKTKFRTQNLKFVAGKRNFETLYRENGIELFVNPRDVYFSSKLSKERENLLSSNLEYKNILVMFSGLGPYTFVAIK